MSIQCPRASLVEAVRDGRLKGSERESFLRHQRACADCTGERERLDTLATALRSLPVQLPDALSVRRRRISLMMAVDAALLVPRAKALRGRRLVVGFASVALLSAIGALAFSRARGRWSEPTVRAVPVIDEPRVDVEASPGARWHQIRVGTVTRVDVEDGRFRLRIRRNSAATQVLIGTPDGEIEDRGTTFGIVVAGQKTVQIAVDEGSVVARLHELPPFELTAGQSWDAASVASGASPEASPKDAQKSDHARLGAPVVTGAVGGAKRSRSSARAAGELASEAEDRAYLHVVESLHKGEVAVARRAARDYLLQFPNGFRRVEMINMVTGSGTDP